MAKCPKRCRQPPTEDEWWNVMNSMVFISPDRFVSSKILEMVPWCFFISKNIEDSLFLCHNEIEKYKLLEDDGGRNILQWPFFTTHEDHGLLSNCLRTEVPSTSQHNCCGQSLTFPTIPCHRWPWIASSGFTRDSQSFNSRRQNFDAWGWWVNWLTDVDRTCCDVSWRVHLELFGCTLYVLPSSKSTDSTGKASKNNTIPLPHVAPWSDILWYQSFF